MQTTTPCVVVTDVTRPADLTRCVQQVRRSVPRDVEVVVITGRARALPPALARAVRVVVAASGAAFTAALTAEAERDRLVVVARSDCRLSPGWFEHVLARAAGAPAAVGTLGGDDPHLLVFPARVRSTSAAHLPWAPVAGVGLVAGAGRPAPPRTTTISASLIVKDEEEVIGACLAALEGVVDEVVVYDTGSTDATVEIARAHGARVHLGYWDDHFGNARNRALEHSTSEWVLHVDADEVLTGDGAALRERLAAEAADLVRVVVVSTSWKDATEGFESRPVRLFRRERFTWTGALHEYVVPLPDVEGATLSPVVADVRLLHSGYQRVTFQEKDKTARNADIAAAAVAAAAPDDPAASALWSNYGRALATAGRTEEALEALEHLFLPGSNSTAVVSGARAAVVLLVAAARWEEVERWLELMAAHGEAQGNLAATRASCLFARGEVDAAAAELDGITDDLDTWGAPHVHAPVARLRVLIAVSRGDRAQALALLEAELAEHSETVDIEVLLRTTAAEGGSLEDLAARAPEVFVARSLRDAFSLTGGLALTWFEALHTARPDDVRALVAGSVAGARSDFETALTWSVRARQAGQPQLCALRTWAGAPDRDPVLAGAAWALLADAFGEEAALVRLLEARAAMDDDAAARLAGHVASLAPDLLPVLQLPAPVG